MENSDVKPTESNERTMFYFPFQHMTSSKICPNCVSFNYFIEMQNKLWPLKIKAEKENNNESSIYLLIILKYLGSKRSKTRETWISQRGVEKTNKNLDGRYWTQWFLRDNLWTGFQDKNFFFFFFLKRTLVFRDDRFWFVVGETKWRTCFSNYFKKIIRNAGLG